MKYLIVSALLFGYVATSAGAAQNLQTGQPAEQQNKQQTELQTNGDDQVQPASLSEPAAARPELPPEPAVDGWEEYQNGDYPTARRLFMQAARQGDRVAQYDLAVMYWHGEGMPANRRLALQWLHKAAAAQLADAQFMLGKLYEAGDGVPRNLKQATGWYEKAAGQGHLEAQINVATQYFLGRGAPHDEQRAASWYRKAAEQGDASAQYLIASMYQHGNGVAQDPAQALRWYQAAAAQGDPAAAGLATELQRQIDGAGGQTSGQP